MGCPGRAWSAVVEAWLLLWARWWLVTLLWIAAAISTIHELNFSTHKAMLTVFANLVIGTPLVLPFAVASGGFKRLRMQFWKVLCIAVLTGLEKNLTNASLSTIGASLKTALHSFNAVFAVLASALLNRDNEYWCIYGCHCRGQFRLAASIVLVVSGGIVTAVFSATGSAWTGSLSGIVLQLSSGLAYGFKLALIKMMLRGGDQDSSSAPSKYWIACVANPVTGLVGLAFLPLIGEPWEMPDLGTAAKVSVWITCIFFAELRLTELTSPVTVAVLSLFKNIATIVFFAVFHKDTLGTAQASGFAVSMVGAVCFACVRKKTAARLLDETFEDTRPQVEDLSFPSDRGYEMG